MKTYTEYEARDIKIGKDSGEDPIHTFLMVQVLLIGLTGMNKQPDDPPNDPLFPLKRHVAQFLNSMEREGLTLTSAELPAAFKESSRG
jgi:hypothetical protein